MAPPGSGAAVRRLRAPAKINLGLRVLTRRPDGYHLLESVFLPLDLADEVAVQVEEAPAAEAALDLEGAVEGVPEGRDNLALRAARGFLAGADLRCRVRVRLAKHIPPAAGLGGGSSDAGAVLRALSAAFPEALSREALAYLALDLGADVPFFLDPRPALVSGVGERVEPLPGEVSLALVLAHPGALLPTAEVFRAHDVLSPAGSEPAAAALRALWGRVAGGGPDRDGALAELSRNDLEPAALRLCPPIGRLRERLLDVGAACVGMSGSGPTLYGVFASVAAAEEALARASFEPPVWARVASAGRFAGRAGGAQR